MAGGEGGRRFKELLGEFTELLGVFNVGDFIPWLGWIIHINGLDAKVEKVAKEFDEFLDVVVEEHVEISKTKEKSSACVDEGEDRKDIVDVLLEVQEHSNVAGSSIDGDSIKGTILVSVFFSTGMVSELCRTHYPGQLVQRTFMTVTELNCLRVFCDS